MLRRPLFLAKNGARARSPRPSSQHSVEQVEVGITLYDGRPGGGAFEAHSRDGARTQDPAEHPLGQVDQRESVLRRACFVAAVRRSISFLPLERLRTRSRRGGTMRRRHSAASKIARALALAGLAALPAGAADGVLEIDRRARSSAASPATTPAIRSRSRTRAATSSPEISTCARSRIRRTWARSRSTPTP